MSAGLVTFEMKVDILCILEVLLIYFLLDISDSNMYLYARNCLRSHITLGLNTLRDS